MIESVLTSKGQTTLPKPIREHLGVSPGDRIRYIISGREVRILPVRPVSRLFGTLKHEGPPVSLSDMKRAVEEGARDA